MSFDVLPWVMWIVALNAFAPSFVAPIVDRGQVGSGRIRVLERCVAAHAKGSLFIERQVLHVVRMIT
jgi:hypothetical protein